MRYDEAIEKLEGRVDALETKEAAPAVDLTELTARIAALEARVPELKDEPAAEGGAVDKIQASAEEVSR